MGLNWEIDPQNTGLVSRSALNKRVFGGWWLSRSIDVVDFYHIYPEMQRWKTLKQFGRRKRMARPTKGGLTANSHLPGLLVMIVPELCQSRAAMKPGMLCGEAVFEAIRRCWKRRRLPVLKGEDFFN